MGTLDSHKTVIESVRNEKEGVDICNRHREKIGSGFIHVEEGNLILTGYVQDDAYEGSLEEAGLSIGWNALDMKAREVDGIAFYKDVVVKEVSLTPLPSNKGAKVTKVREEENKEEEEGEQKDMGVNDGLNAVIEQLAEEKAEKKALETKVRELEEAQAEMKKEREAQIPTDTAKDDEEVFYRELGAEMQKTPEKTFLREFTNAGDLAVSNQLGSITSQWASKSSLFAGATKARFQGLTLADDGDNGIFKRDLFVAGGDKKEQLTATKRSLRPQMAYAYMEMDKGTVSGVDDTGELSKYVMSVLPQRVINQIEFNMIYGKHDGSNGIYGLKGDTTGWTPQLTFDLAKVDLFEVLTDAIAEVSYNQNVVVVMHPKTYAELRKAKGSDGHSRFNELATKEQIANSFGAISIETRAWMGQNEIAMYIKEEFVLIGDLDMNNYVDFDLRYNVDQWLAEMLVGGSIRGRGRSVFITLTPKAEA